MQNRLNIRILHIALPFLLSAGCLLPHAAYATPLQDDLIAIRTAIIKDGRLYAQAGAGIVYDSNPDSEWQETLNKASALIAAAALLD